MHAIDHVIDHFPENGALTRRLYLRDEHFRGICDDLALALGSLRRFESREDAERRPEIAEYRRLIAEIEAEVRGYLRAAGANRRPGP